MIQNIVSAILLMAGMVFCLTTIIGMYRLPDFYSRCHSSGTSETMALLLICLGFIIYSGWNVLSIKLVLLFFIVCICNPIGSHVLTRAAYRSNYPMKV